MTVDIPGQKDRLGGSLRHQNWCDGDSEVAAGHSRLVEGTLSVLPVPLHVTDTVRQHVTEGCTVCYCVLESQYRPSM